MTVWHTAYAWLPGGLARDVTLVAKGGRFTEINVRQSPGDLCPPADATPLPGITVPGFANAHSHAFHRALRGRTEHKGGSFWTWRNAMYAVAGRLDPDRYLALARAAYAEMALAGVTAVGEFHYLHHGPGGQPYDEPNAMGEALIEAADDAGIRITLLDACYLAGGLTAGGHLPLEGVQERFGDGHVDGWAGRFASLRSSETVRIGAAIHSVRAVPSEALAVVAEVAGDQPLHAHLSEQPAENEACMEVYGISPTALLHAEGVLGTSTTAIHATHVSASDIATLGETGTAVCLCPTTERNLGDGIGPARALFDAGSPLCLGSDQHSTVDLLEEARALEMNDRLASMERGRFTIAELVGALGAGGHASLGWNDAGVLAVGARADLVAIRLDSTRTAGAAPEQALLAAGAADVDTVVVDGRTVVSGGQHVLGNVAAMLAAAIEPLWTEQ
ncbi:MAG: formimidoylglutamate deiminase [Acidimicrobiaceae bacterium]|nr:formimidoylglutamate deiminase [Acidimicrobiaceae bacterium]